MLTAPKKIANLAPLTFSDLPVRTTSRQQTLKSNSDLYSGSKMQDIALNKRMKEHWKIITVLFLLTVKFFTSMNPQFYRNKH